MLTTLPNLLTLSRIVAVPLVVATFYLDPPLGPWAGCLIFSLAGFTDWLDGRLARAWHQQSAWDQYLVGDRIEELAPSGLLMPGAGEAVVILARAILVSGL